MFMENGAPDIYNLEIVVSSVSDFTTELTLFTPVRSSGFTSQHTLQPGQVRNAHHGQQSINVHQASMTQSLYVFYSIFHANSMKDAEEDIKVYAM